MCVCVCVYVFTVSVCVRACLFTLCVCVCACLFTVCVCVCVLQKNIAWIYSFIWYRYVRFYPSRDYFTWNLLKIMHYKCRFNRCTRRLPAVPPNILSYFNSRPRQHSHAESAHALYGRVILTVVLVNTHMQKVHTHCMGELFKKSYSSTLTCRRYTRTVWVSYLKSCPRQHSHAEGTHALYGRVI